MKNNITRATVKNFDEMHPINLTHHKTKINPQIAKLYKVHGRSYFLNFPMVFSLEELLDIYVNRAPNRNIDCSKVMCHIVNILSGNWDMELGDTICFNEDGRLNDGQNRIAAFLIIGQIPLLPWGVAINVKQISVKENKDTGKKRGLNDKATLCIRNQDNPRMNLHEIEARIVAYSSTLSPLGRRLNGGKLTAGNDVFDRVYEDADKYYALTETLKLYDNLNIHKAIKKSEEFWTCMYRSYQYFKSSDRLGDWKLFPLTVFNSMSNASRPYDKWAKKTKEQIDINIRNKEGSGARRANFYATCNLYLRKYYDKEDCEEGIRSRQVSAKMENFPFPDEIEREIEMDKEQSEKKLYSIKEKVSR